MGMGRLLLVRLLVSSHRPGQAGQAARSEAAGELPGEVL